MLSASSSSSRISLLSMYRFRFMVLVIVLFVFRDESFAQTGTLTDDAFLGLERLQLHLGCGK
jgi:hypothetical protein